MDPNANCHRQGLVAFFRFPQVDAEIMKGHCLHPDCIRALHLQTVNTDVFFVDIVQILQIFRHNTGLGEIETTVVFIHPKQWQEFVKVDVVPYYYLLAWRVGDMLQFAGKLAPPAV